MKAGELFDGRNTSTDAHPDVNYQLVFDFHSASLLEHAYTPDFLSDRSTLGLKGLHERPGADSALWRILNDDIEFGGRNISRIQTNLATRLLLWFSFVTIVHIIDVFVAASFSHHTGTR